MEAVIDKILAEVTTFKDTPSAEGGCSDILPIEVVWFGDPGIVMSELYPCVFVEPISDVPESETTGYEVRDLEISVTILIDIREEFDATVDEADGTRKLVQTAERLRSWLRRVGNRQLDGLQGVREVRVTSTDYMGQVRGSVVAKTAQITLLVNKQFPKQD